MMFWYRKCSLLTRPSLGTVILFGARDGVFWEPSGFPESLEKARKKTHMGSAGESVLSHLLGLHCVTEVVEEFCLK